MSCFDFHVLAIELKTNKHVNLISMRCIDDVKYMCI